MWRRSRDRRCAYLHELWHSEPCPRCSAEHRPLPKFGEKLGRERWYSSPANATKRMYASRQPSSSTPWTSNGGRGHGRLRRRSGAMLFSLSIVLTSLGCQKEGGEVEIDELGVVAHYMGATWSAHQWPYARFAPAAMLGDLVEDGADRMGPSVGG
jgi:hypothetical protein